MTQIAIVQPAAPQATTTAPQASSGSQNFSSHFEKAVSDQKEQVSTRDNHDNRDTQASDKVSSQDKTPSSAKNSQDKTKDTAQAKPEDREVASDSADIPAKDEKVGRQMSVQEFLIALSAEVPAATAVATAGTTAENTSAPIGQTVAPTLLVSMPGTQLENVSADAAPNAQTQADQKPTDTFLAQLQQLIENSNEEGTVTITREDSPPVPGNGGKAVQNLWPQQAGEGTVNPLHAVATADDSGTTVQSQVIIADGVNAPEKPEQTSSMRQNTQQQYLEAKINLKAFEKKEDSASQEQQQGNEPSAQGQVANNGQGLSSETPLTLDQTNTFSQSLASAQNPSAHPTTDTGQAVTLPSGTVVHSDDVLQQIMDRFQLNKKPLDTQINIKLHPAELGELKIDLTVKEGSIRANVVAQSQHAQEIIEKNMPKLRSVLEEHGLTVETITVSSKTDWDSDTGLFDRQLFSQGDYTPQPRKRRQEAENAFRLEQAFFPNQSPTTTGVNVKI